MKQAGACFRKVLDYGINQGIDSTRLQLPDIVRGAFLLIDS